MGEPWHFEKLHLKSGLNMQVARAGQDGGKPLIVMLHGFPECWYSWRHQLRALAPHFECVAPDLRGYGDTDAPVGIESYSLDQLVGDVADLIEACGRQRAIIMAHDWGGAIAWATALKRPELVEKLIVMNCPHLKKFRDNLLHNPRQMLKSWYILFFQIPRLPEALLRARDFSALKRTLRDSAVQKSAFSDEDLAHYQAAFRNPYSITAALNYYRALFRDNLRNRKSPEWMERKIAAPTMVIWGEQDVALRKELTFGMKELFSGPFEIHYVSDSGHWVQQEKPVLVNHYVSKFLSVRTSSSE
jgi:pimeloyl-ACP methyl ester carboxylesterase